MRASSFRLSPVLRYREQIVELRQQELADAERELQAAQSDLARLREKLAALSRAIGASQLAGSLDPADMAARFHHREMLLAQEQVQIGRVGALAREHEDRRTRLSAAMQEKQVLDKLKERHETAQRHEENRKETQTLDEMGVIRYYRRGLQAQAPEPNRGGNANDER